MLVSTKSRYALRVMIDLAEHQGSGYTPLKEIARRQGISEKYLEAVLKVLVQERYIIGLRGKGGGYMLGIAPEQITVGSVIRLAEGSLAPVACLTPSAPPCSRAAECRTLPLWQELEQSINGLLDNYTIADLACAPESSH